MMTCERTNITIKLYYSNKMPRYKKDITPEELALKHEESKRKNQISQSRAKAKYRYNADGSVTEEYRATQRRYYEKNKQKINARRAERSRIVRQQKKEEREMLMRFYEANKDRHEEFFKESVPVN